MTYNIIATGSTGNAVIIGGNILVDCGVPYKAIKPYVKDLQLVLLSHVHSDHFRSATVRTLHRERPTLRFGCCAWMVRPLFEAGVDMRMIDVYRENDRFFYPGTNPLIKDVEAVKTLHNVPNCAWKMQVGGEKVFYATDCSTLEGIEAKWFDLYLIESNHTRAEIEERIAEKRAAGEFAYELEAMRNHLSEEQALAWLAENAGPDSHYQFLHQHIDKKGDT